MPNLNKFNKGKLMGINKGIFLKKGLYLNSNVQSIDNNLKYVRKRRDNASKGFQELNTTKKVQILIYRL